MLKSYHCMYFLLHDGSDNLMIFFFVITCFALSMLLKKKKRWLMPKNRSSSGRGTTLPLGRCSSTQPKITENYNNTNDQWNEEVGRRAKWTKIRNFKTNFFKISESNIYIRSHEVTQNFISHICDFSCYVAICSSADWDG